jgi:hypothetical protein
MQCRELLHKYIALAGEARPKYTLQIFRLALILLMLPLKEITARRSCLVPDANNKRMRVAQQHLRRFVYQTPHAPGASNNPNAIVSCEAEQVVS